MEDILKWLGNISLELVSVLVTYIMITLGVNHTAYLHVITILLDNINHVVIPSQLHPALELATHNMVNHMLKISIKERLPTQLELMFRPSKPN